MTGMPHFSPLRARLAAVVLVVQIVLVGVLALNMSQSWDQVARSSLEKRLQELAKRRNFTLVSHQIELTGTCESCIIA